MSNLIDRTNNSITDAEIDAVLQIVKDEMHEGRNGAWLNAERQDRDVVPGAELKVEIDGGLGNLSEFDRARTRTKDELDLELFHHTNQCGTARSQLWFRRMPRINPT